MSCPFIHKQQSTRPREGCTPTQQQDYCRDDQNRDILRWKRRKRTFISANLCFMCISVWWCFIQAMHVVLFWAPVVYNDFVCFFGFMILSWGLNEKNHTGFCYFMPPSSPVLLRHFLLFEPLPVSSRCHFAFHPPHPLVRISAALLWASAGEYGSLWVFFFFFLQNVFCACSNSSSHCVELSSTFEPPVIFSVWQVNKGKLAV